MRTFLVIAGEASSDLQAAHLLKEIKSLSPESKFFGAGGRRLAEEGMEILVSAERLNVVGGADWFDKITDVFRAYRQLKTESAQRNVDAAVLLDLPDFNLRMARHLKRLGIPVVYYISPQVWAWRRYRIRTIRNTVDRMLVVFPFEKEFYDQHRVAASFVGHPLMEQIARRTEHRAQPEVLQAPRIALLPGSRDSELRHHARILRELGALLMARFPAAEIRIPIASTLTATRLRETFPESHFELSGDSRETLRWADVAAVASGTATLETALLGTPFCLFYKMNASTSWLVRNLIRYRRPFGMPNLLLGSEVVREFIQDQASAASLSTELFSLIENEDRRAKLSGELSRCREILGDGGASRKAAVEILSFVSKFPRREVKLVTAPA